MSSSSLKTPKLPLSSPRAAPKVHISKEGAKQRGSHNHNVGTVPMFKIHNVGTVPTSKLHKVGRVEACCRAEKGHVVGCNGM